MIPTTTTITTTTTTTTTTTKATTIQTTSTTQPTISERKFNDEVQASSKTNFAESQDYYSIDPTQYLITRSDDNRELTAIEKIDQTWQKVINSLASNLKQTETSRDNSLQNNL